VKLPHAPCLVLRKNSAKTMSMPIAGYGSAVRRLSPVIITADALAAIVSAIWRSALQRIATRSCRQL